MSDSEETQKILPPEKRKATAKRTKLAAPVIPPTAANLSALLPQETINKLKELHVSNAPVYSLRDTIKSVDPF